MRPERLTLDIAPRFYRTIADLLGYRRTHPPALFALRVIVNVAMSFTCACWFLSSSHSLMADVGSNSTWLRGIGFLSSPKGLTFYIIDRAVITNSIEMMEVSASPSGWDNDAMQQPFDKKMTLLGVSIWYRTRQCLIMVSARYSTVLCLCICCALLIHRSSRTPNANEMCFASCST